MAFQVITKLRPEKTLAQFVNDLDCNPNAIRLGLDCL